MSCSADLQLGHRRGSAGLKASATVYGPVDFSLGRMANSVLSRIPVVAGLAYAERVRRLPSSFTATLAIEAGNRYFPHAIAVLGNGEKVGYVAPEVARGFYAAIQNYTGVVTCPARRGTRADHEASGVELLLDFTGLPVTAE